MKYLTFLLIFVFIYMYFLPCGKIPAYHINQSTRPIIYSNSRNLPSRIPTIVQNPKPNQIKKYSQWLDKYYDFVTTPFTFEDIQTINNAYMVFDSSDLIQRSILFNLPKKYAKKSILLQDDVTTVGKFVSFLKAHGNNVGLLVNVCSLSDAYEDVHLLGLQKDIDYKYSRILPNGIEYLPANNFTDVYVNFIKTRLSQLKRCGFDFVQLGHFDPFSIFHYKYDSYDINPEITYERCQEFLLDILNYCKHLELKISLSEFPRIFENSVYKIAPLVDYISIYTLDPRTYIKPHIDYIYYFMYKPVFLTSHLYTNDNIPYFIYNTNWPIEYSIIYESGHLFEPHLNLVQNHFVVGNRYIDWSFPPKKTWKVEIPILSNIMPYSLPVTLDLMPIPKLLPPQ